MIDYASQLLEEGFNMSVERISGVNDNMYSSHYHNYYELYYLESGERFHLIEDNIHLLTPGQFVFFEPYILHRSYGEKDIPFSRLLIYFKKELLESQNILEGLNGFTGVYKLNTSENNSVYSILNKILEEQNHPKDFSEEYLKSLLNALLIIILRNKKSKRTDNLNNKITEVISYINLNYTEKINIEMLSKNFYISPWHLCREFKLYTNVTIIQYINSIRIINAQKMLYRTNKKITEICCDVGFESITHFERIFKSIVGSTPSQFKKKINI